MPNIISLLYTASLLALAAQAPAAELRPRSGALIYNMQCAECHLRGVNGAPKLSDRPAWAARLAQGPTRLIEHAIHGYKIMPARGSCSTCTDAEITAAVQYMITRLND
ncbi:MULTISPECIES: c-type cytochrome [unclassified Undibacterium]|uniref:c-type cytochrome n=1 Tax=unclassified Undibacterium TaxID=2630295 RepID=UPI002AC9C0F5|nr:MULTISPECIES: c-type cytochrome [unclassified Undibacterium]MEB0137600.1 c-type cytochrome [Undibacterium sp. CCC2.1]MEB0170601.1 c-type cytochrome [Undibacterium sp. CCC1.1]MEB0174542.1 c-type cytochrome [Undibacterium sp. CCC3.4]MEB0213661.1 c-type cytochrome [Undibacterium sp. 5I2]WPX43827.1 c-type cytochrome [Undibacterium sp. CCC3.4]